MGAPASVEDFRDVARKRLPHMLFEYVDAGSYREETLRRNRDALTSLMLRQRVLVNGSNLSFETSFLGQSLNMPLILAPVGFAGMYARRGEVQAARAARSRGLPFCLSSVSICGYEEVARDAGVPPWFQCYVIRDRAYMASLLGRVWNMGARVLVLTVDLPTPGARYRDARSGFMDTGPKAFLRQVTQGLSHPKWLWDVYLRGRPHEFANFAAVLKGTEWSLGGYRKWIGENFDTSVTWSDLEELRTRWKGQIVVKGILDIEDARRAAAIGVDGIVVSNHGGRQLDSVRSGVELLPEIVATVGNDVTVLVDGGIRTGLDLLRVLALGAKGCLIGRPWIWGLSAEGQRGVETVLDIIRQELRVAMILTGCADVREAGPQLLDRVATMGGALGTSTQSHDYASPIERRSKRSAATRGAAKPGRKSSRTFYSPGTGS
jgi:L-lactate dehydrogenase (cytochrome)